MNIITDVIFYGTPAAAVIGAILMIVLFQVSEHSNKTNW